MSPCLITQRQEDGKWLRAKARVSPWKARQTVTVGRAVGGRGEGRLSVPGVTRVTGWVPGPVCTLWLGWQGFVCPPQCSPHFRWGDPSPATPPPQSIPSLQSSCCTEGCTLPLGWATSAGLAALVSLSAEWVSSSLACRLGMNNTGLGGARATAWRTETPHRVQSQLPGAPRSRAPCFPQTDTASSARRQ